MSDRPTLSVLVPLTASPLAIGLGWAMGGGAFAVACGAWALAASANLWLVARLAAVAPAALSSKLPVTLVVAAVALQVSDPRAMVVGLVSTVAALLWVAVATFPVAPAALEER
jgi:hypothetical protein